LKDTVVVTIPGEAQATVTDARLQAFRSFLEGKSTEAKEFDMSRIVLAKIDRAEAIVLHDEQVRASASSETAYGTCGASVVAPEGLRPLAW
jgi:hypothetical protein